MKKTEFKTLSLQFSIAMSAETGCLVMLRGDKVMGSLSREQSLGLAESVIQFKQQSNVLDG